MVEDRVDRRLAAIFAGDIGGYSRLMGALYCLDREECPLYARSDGQIFGWYAQGGPAVDEIERLDDVRFWHKADITNVLIHVRFRR